MAGVGLAVLSDEGEFILTTSGPTSGAQVVGASFIGGHRYLCFGHVTVTTQVNTLQPRVRMFFPDSAAADVDYTFQMRGTDVRGHARRYFTSKVVTADGTSPLKLEIDDLSVASSSSFYWPSVIAIDLDSVGADLFNRDSSFHPDFQTASSVVTTQLTATFQPFSTLTFTAEANSLYMVLAQGMIRENDAAVPTFLQPQMQLNVERTSDSLSILTTGEITEWTSQNPNQTRIAMPMMAMLSTFGTPPGSFTKSLGEYQIEAENQFDVQVQMRELTAGIVEHRRSDVMLLRLSAFKEVTTHTDLINLNCSTSGSTAIRNAGCDLAPSGITTANLPFGSFDSSPKDRLTFFGFDVDETSVSSISGLTFSLFDRLAVDDASIQGPSTLNAFLNGFSTTDRWWIMGVNHELTGLGGLALRLNMYAQTNTLTGGQVGEVHVVSMFTTLKEINTNPLTLGLVIADLKQIDTDLALAVAAALQQTAGLSAVVAEARTRVASLNQAVAQIILLTGDLSPAVAQKIDKTVGMDVFKEGSEQRTATLRVVVASAEVLTATIDNLVAETSQLFVLLNLAVTDEPSITIEPDRPKFPPIVTVTDLETS